MHPEGVDDDELARALKLSARQQANSRCRQLEAEGLVVRRPVDGKIRTFWKEGAIPPAPLPVTPVTYLPDNSLPAHEHWFWEGNVQSRVIDYLRAHGYEIRSSADTASHQQGIDIVAERDGRPLWVSVKGYPQGTARTNPTVQAAHWFKQVIFDMVAYREQDPNAMLAVALPDYPRYHALARKITWLKPAAGSLYFWISEDGKILVE